jgi:hypothetical protein
VVEPDVPAIHADVATIVANIRPCETGVPPFVEVSALGLCGSGGKEKTYCDQYGKFRFHDIHFYWFIESIAARI